MPRVCCASDVASWGIVAKWLALSGTWSQCELSGSLYSHLAFIYLGHIIYQKHFSGTNTLPVAHCNAAQVCSDCCIWPKTVWWFWSTAVTHRSVSLMKPNPLWSSDVWWWCISLVLGINLLLEFFWNNGVLTAAQIWGLAPLPCLMPAMGVPHALHPWDVLESPNVDWMWCCMPWSVLIILWTATLSAPSQHKLNAVIMSTILSATLGIIWADCQRSAGVAYIIVQETFVQTLDGCWFFLVAPILFQCHLHLY